MDTNTRASQWAREVARYGGVYVIDDVDTKDEFIKDTFDVLDKNFGVEAIPADNNPARIFLLPKAVSKERKDKLISLLKDREHPMRNTRYITLDEYTSQK